MDTIPPALAALTEYNQWILWKLVRHTDKKDDKIPIDYRTGGTCDPHLSDSWTTAENALAYAPLFGSDYGVGFVFTSDDPFYFLDIDHCNHGGTWSPLALELMQAFSGAAVEVSQSKTGLHIFGKATHIEHTKKNSKLDIELYTEKRFVALTGDSVVGDAGIDSSAAFASVVAKYFPAGVGTVTGLGWTSEPIEGYNSKLDDDSLIKKMLSTKSAAGAFGSGSKFSALWNKDVDSLSDSYPDHESGPTRPYDDSIADAALAQHLAFWTGNNCERMLSLMWRSNLHRKKWNKADYLRRTMLSAVAKQHTWFSFKEPVIPLTELGNVEGPREGYQWLPYDLQLDYFKDCVYIAATNRILTPGGQMLDQQRFNGLMGGYTFMLESGTNKVTHKAWEAFTESRMHFFPKAADSVFKPKKPFQEITVIDGLKYVNVYREPNIESRPGDIEPFLTLLKKMITDPNDLKILLSYCAAMLQHKGVKFQWAPLIQGMPGNGKTLITRVMQYAIGKQYTHLPPASEIAEKYNSWLFNRLFIGVEDVYVAEHKREVIEILKPMITNIDLAMRAMHQDQTMKENVANFILNCNEQDAIRKTATDRRFCIFFTAQQTLADLERDGMTGDYFNKLYEWLRVEGYAYCAHYLQNYKIEDSYNPAKGSHRAPVTTSTKEALEIGRGGVEGEIVEAIESERPGFAGGWVSSKALQDLLERHGAARYISRVKRKKILEEMGYIYHPALNAGRANNLITFDQARSTLFIKQDHISAQIKGNSEAVKAYVTAQSKHGFSYLNAEQVFKK